MLLMLELLLGSAMALEIVIDDQDGSPHFTTTGDDWATWSTLNLGFDTSDTEYHYTSHTVGGGDRRGTATWTPDIGADGTWRVQTWFRATENRTDDADFVVTDGLGKTHHKSVDQRGDGASGWVTLAEVWCAEGMGGCSVTLDANDDDQSDEANAVRFLLLDEEPQPESDCDEALSPGSHTLVFLARSSDGTGWEAPAEASGEPDGVEAWSQNVDAGEVLRAAFELCDPPGEESLDRVTLGVRARTQYESGTYALRLLLEGGGASSVFTGTQPSWHEVDLPSPTWQSLAGLQASVSLHDHPGGQRDSDAWVDAFRLTVQLTVPEAEGSPSDTGAGLDTDHEEAQDSGVFDSASPRWTPPPGDRQPLLGGCSTAPRRTLIGLLLCFAAVLVRRQR